jgi:hypothetical protein
VQRSPAWDRFRVCYHVVKPMDAAAISKAKWDFDEKQHDQIRADIQGLEAYGRTFDSVGIVAIAALWTWGLKDGGLDSRTIGVMSALIALLSGLKAIAVWRLIAAKANYIKQIETDHSEIGGYETKFNVPASSFIVPALIFLILLIVSLYGGFCWRYQKQTAVAPTPVTITCVPPSNAAPPHADADRTAPSAKLP